MGPTTRYIPFKSYFPPASQYSTCTWKDEISMALIVTTDGWMVNAPVFVLQGGNWNRSLFNRFAID